MLRGIFLLGLVSLLAACGDPLTGFDRIEDVELADTDAAAQALPTEAEIAREGFFGTEAALGNTDSPVEAAPQTDVVAEVKTVLPAPTRAGRLLGLLRGAAPAPSAPVPPADLQEAENRVPEDSDAETEEVLLAALPPEETEPRAGGLFRGGLLGGSSRSTAAKRNIADVPYGTVLPFGQIARVCEARRKPLGRKVASASARGFKLYDSNPGTAGPRTYYITGFADTCPRQLTGANVLFGAPSFYELLHYGPTGQHLAYADTDKAYEKVKADVCGARKGKPCGARMNQLERDTFFVNSYPRFGDNAAWSEMLIHKDTVVATAMKSGG